MYSDYYTKITVALCKSKTFAGINGGVFQASACLQEFKFAVK